MSSFPLPLTSPHTHPSPSIKSLPTSHPPVAEILTPSPGLPGPSDLALPFPPLPLLPLVGGGGSGRPPQGGDHYVEL